MEILGFLDHMVHNLPLALLRIILLNITLPTVPRTLNLGFLNLDPNLGILMLMVMAHFLVGPVPSLLLLLILRLLIMDMLLLLKLLLLLLVLAESNHVNIGLKVGVGWRTLVASLTMVHLAKKVVLLVGPEFLFLEKCVGIGRKMVIAGWEKNVHFYMVTNWKTSPILQVLLSNQWEVSGLNSLFMKK